MQRSRKALLQRRALESTILSRKRLYKVSLSVIFIFLGLCFLLNLWVGHDNCYGVSFSPLGLFAVIALGVDGSGIVVGKSTWRDTDAVGANNASNYTDKFVSEEMISDCHHQEACILSGETRDGFHQSLAAEERKLESIRVGNKEEIAMTDLEVQEDVEISGLGAKMEKKMSKGERLSRIMPVGLDEFKSKSTNPKGKHVTSWAGGIMNRVEPNGREYNYASASKGAKVLAFNSEAKGAFNILDKDKDKYLRNPCSAEEKFVDIELSEETLVDTVEIANFEHYSSNLKDFELLSSLVYPTDSWVRLGNFTATNVKHVQRFILEEPKWARYLKVKLLSHYGSEFYCTLSVLEVYGVDAVERMLEDLMPVQDYRFGTEETIVEPIPSPVHLEPIGEDPLHRKIHDENKIEFDLQNHNMISEISKNSVPDPVIEVRAQQAGRMPGDTVLKILMQKIQSLDLNFSVLEKYLEELNIRYNSIFSEFDDDIADKYKLLEQIMLEIKHLVKSKEVLVEDTGELIAWKYLVSQQLDGLVRDNSILRSEVGKLHDNVADMEKRVLATIFTSFSFVFLAAIKIFLDSLVRVFRTHDHENCGRTSSAWPLMLWSSAIVVIFLLI